MKIDCIVVGAFQSNCFIVTEDNRSAIVIDPGSDPDEIEAFLADRRLSPSVYLLTHGHMDHISALARIHAIHPAPVAIHSADLQWAFTHFNQMPPFFPVPDRPAAEERILEDGQTWTDASLTYRVIGTPGHSPGSVCFLFKEQKVLFSGDTLFAGGGVGRTDLHGGSSRALTDSLRRLAELPDDIRICCGHGPDSDMGHEKKHNYFMQRYRS